MSGSWCAWVRVRLVSSFPDPRRKPSFHSATLRGPPLSENGKTFECPWTSKCLGRGAPGSSSAWSVPFRTLGGSLRFTRQRSEVLRHPVSAKTFECPWTSNGLGRGAPGTSCAWSVPFRTLGGSLRFTRQRSEVLRHPVSAKTFECPWTSKCLGRGAPGSSCAWSVPFRTLGGSLRFTRQRSEVLRFRKTGRPSSVPGPRSVWAKTTSVQISYRRPN